MPDEGVKVADVDREILGVAAFPRRASVTPRVPREDRRAGAGERGDEFVPTAGVFVPAVQEQDGPADGRVAVGGQPSALELVCPVVRAELLLRASSIGDDCGRGQDVHGTKLRKG